jgi:hypothetical protein
LARRLASAWASFSRRVAQIASARPTNSSGSFFPFRLKQNSYRDKIDEVRCPIGPGFGP